MAEMDSPKKPSVGPNVLITLAAVCGLIGIGRCGFLSPVIKGTREDYGIGGAFLIVVAVVLLSWGLTWRSRRGKEAS